MTIVFSNPSRFDLEQGKWLSGYAGIFIANSACKGISLSNTELRLAELQQPLRYGTKVVLLLGQRSLDEYCKTRSQLIDNDIRLDQQRGSPIESPTSGIIYIASYLPQDAMDMKAAYEKDNNEYINQGLSKEEDDDVETKEISETGAKGTKGLTSRSNYKFFLERDCKKAIGFLLGTRKLDKIDTSNFQIYPPAETIIYELTNNKGQDLYFDIETMDWLCNMSCFGFSFGNNNVYVCPFYRYDYSPAYTELPQILYSLGMAISNNNVIGHNIAGFDLFVLAYFYKLSIGKSNYDTMLAMHRLFPEVEKSLGHGISLYTNLPYHKNEGIFNPKNLEQERQLWEYNGKDVASLKYLKQGIDEEAKKKFACGSIEQVNKSIRPYLIISLTGIHYDQKELEDTVIENDKRCNAILKIISYLIGYVVLPTSNKQCVDYFHTCLGMKIVKRSPKTNKPSLAEGCLLTLYIKQEHPIIPLFIYFRQLVKETGSLGFIPWKRAESVTQPIIEI